MSLERDNPQDVAWLIYESAPELFALIFGRNAVPILTALVKRSHNRFSNRYIRVAQASSRVLGIAIVVGAAEVNDNADYHTVLSFWGQLRLQLVQSLILNRVLKHDYPPGTFYIANLAVHPDDRAKGIRFAIALLIWSTNLRLSCCIGLLRAILPFTSTLISAITLKFLTS